MKAFLSFALLAAVALAEPPNYRQQQQQQGQRYFFARQQQQQQQQASGPYPPSGWRPDGPAFNLPQRQQKQQLAGGAYGPPQQSQVESSYGPPAQQAPVDNSYGLPSQQRYEAPDSELGQSPRLPVRQQQPGKFRQFAGQRGDQQQQQQQQQQQEFADFASQQQQRHGNSAGQQFGAQGGQRQFGQQPQRQYGAPEYATADYPSEGDVDEPVTVTGLTEPESEPLSSSNEFQEEGDLDDPQPKRQQQQQQPPKQEQGEYYVALPDGRLQRVRYVSRQDIEAMRYFAKIRAENVEPLRGPIYAYSPLQKLEVAPGNLQITAAAAAGAPAADLVPALTVTAGDAKSEKLLAPEIEVKPLAQIQLQHDNAAAPLSSSYATYAASYQVPEERYILAFP